MASITQTSSHLSTLTEWSKTHIRDIFEAPSDEASLKAVDSTFSENVVASINGAPIDRDGIKQLVLAMRASAPVGLKVNWIHAVDAPSDVMNQVGSFGGVYIIRGIRRTPFGSDELVDFERHKSVTVRIAAQQPTSPDDSRRIVQLVFVATDKPIGLRAKL